MRIAPGFWLAAAWLLWLDGGSGLLPLTASACLLHELGHYLAAALLHIPVKGIRLTAFGAQMYLNRSLPGWQEALVLAAGPGTNLLLAALLCRVDDLQTAGAVHLLTACFNLLPIPPLDGGEMMELFWEGLAPGRTGWLLARLTACGCCAVLLTLGVYLAYLGNPGLLALALWLLSALAGGE